MEYALSLGTNLGDRLKYLELARQTISAHRDIEITAVSALYETEPVDVDPEFSEMNYLNAAIIIETDLSPRELSEETHAIEAEMGRSRSGDINAPRMIDIDIIYAENLVIENERLVIPHPRWAERRFVVQPLADVRPKLIVEGQTLRVEEILLSLPQTPEVLPYSSQWEPN